MIKEEKRRNKSKTRCKKEEMRNIENGRMREIECVTEATRTDPKQRKRGKEVSRRGATKSEPT